MRALAIVAVIALASVMLAGVLSTGELRAQTDAAVRHHAANQVARTVVEYESDRLHIVAAHHFSWGNHDPKWLLIEIGLEVLSGGTVSLTRRDFSIVRPDGVEVPLASQRDYRRARAELLPLQLRLHSLALDPVRSYYPGSQCTDHQLRFFVEGGIRQSVVYVHRSSDCVRGDLYFASPTGAWSSGTYTLVIAGDTDVRLPIEIE